jgi:threonine/homoserine/homoserine lactone efflux protein
MRADRVLDPSRLWLFVLAAIALTATPGPNVLYIVTRGIGQGRRAAVTSAAGVESALFIHVAASALGISAIVASSAVAFTAIRWIGALYLLGLGIQAWRSDGLSVSRPVLPARGRHLFRQGFVVSLLNVKVALFFLAFLPQFVDPSGPVRPQLLLLGGIFVLAAALTDLTYALTSGSPGRWLRDRPAFGRFQGRLSGTVYIGLGLSAAMTGDGP